MKQRIFSAFILIFFFLMLCFPSQTLEGAKSGLLLWFQSVLPTLLPFMILSSLMIHTSAIQWISRISSPFLCRIFRVSPYASFALLTGFLCGYPMGAKTASDLLKNDYITQNESCYLLSFCNNTSPMFLISFIILQNLKCPSLMLTLLSISIFSPVLCSFLFRRYYQIPKYSFHSRFPSVPLHSRRNLADSCMMESLEAITKVGGYMILFSIMINLSKVFLRNLPWMYLLAVPSLELSSGTALICSSTLTVQAKIIYSLTLSSFGGWCCIAQTRSMIQDNSLSILPYIAEKLITASVTSLLTYCYLFFF